MTEGRQVEFVLAVDRITTALRVENLHRLFMSYLTDRIDFERPLAVPQRLFEITALAKNSCGITLDLKKHVAKPTALRPTPIPIGIVGVYFRNVLENIACVESVRRLETD